MKIEGHIFWGEPNSPYNFVSPDEDTGALSEMMPTRPPASQVGPLRGRVGNDLALVLFEFFNDEC